MKNRRPARATTTVSAAVLALALAAPGTALAAGSSAEGKKGGESSQNRPETPPGQQGRDDAPEQQEREDDKDEGEQDEGADGRSAEAPRGENATTQSAGKSGQAPAGKSTAAPADKGKKQSESTAAEAPAPKSEPAPKSDKGDADPAGNNGTIKISSLPVGDGRGNQPHPGCGFALVNYGFDAGQTADITFTHQAPTGSGETLLTRSGVTISDDAAGGGQDRDAVFTFTAADLGLTGPAPHRKGWHVKVAVDALEAPGGAKQKVFWLNCAGETGTAGTGTDTGTETTDTTGGTGTGTDTTDTTGGDGGVSTDATAVLSGSHVRPLATSLIGTTGMTSRTETAAGVLSAGLSRNAAPAAQAPAGSGVLPSVLPFTGAGTIAFLFSLAVLALAAGGAFLRAGHRRAVQ